MLLSGLIQVVAPTPVAELVSNRRFWPAGRALPTLNASSAGAEVTGDLRDRDQGDAERSAGGPGGQRGRVLAGCEAGRQTERVGEAGPTDCGEVPGDGQLRGGAV